MNKKINPVVFWSCVLFFIAVLYFQAQWQNKKMDDRILKNAAYSTGYFTRVRNTKGSRLAMFEFNVGDKLHGSGIGSGAIETVWPYVTDKYFPVIYNKEDTEECDILVFKWDFEKYKMAYPDSLQWVQALYDRIQQSSNR